jgi:hypothetical protein
MRQSIDGNGLAVASFKEEGFFEKHLYRIQVIGYQMLIR